MEPGIGVIRHDSRRMRGRDPRETHHAATPLELLFDLTFATASASPPRGRLCPGRRYFTPAWSALALRVNLLGLDQFLVVSPAYDTDDWLFRLVPWCR